VPDARFVSETQGDLNLKVHESEDDIFVYAINSNTRPLAGSLEVQIGKRTIRSVTEILSDRSMDFLQKGGVITIPIKSEGGDVAVFHLKAR
jgi:hypothetical protein